MLRDQVTPMADLQSPLRYDSVLLCDGIPRKVELTSLLFQPSKNLDSDEDSALVTLSFALCILGRRALGTAAHNMALRYVTKPLVQAPRFCIFVSCFSLFLSWTVYVATSCRNKLCWAHKEALGHCDHWELYIWK